jgi:hypothetical protein
MITPQGPDFLRRELPFLTYLLAPLRLFCPLTFYTVTLKLQTAGEKKKECVTFVRGTAEFGSTALVLYRLTSHGI